MQSNVITCLGYLIPKIMELQAAALILNWALFNNRSNTYFNTLDNSKSVELSVGPVTGHRLSNKVHFKFSAAACKQKIEEAFRTILKW